MQSPRSKPPLLPERLLVRLWRNRDRRRALRTKDGRRLRVLYPGRPNGGPGPDFRDALIQLGSAPPVQGDVEVHRTNSGWSQHGHHRDPQYNNVVLHVVFQYGNGPVTRRQDGLPVPVAELSAEETPVTVPDQYGFAETVCPLVHGWRSRSPKGLRRLLDHAGRRRFLEKSATFDRALRDDGVEEVMYRGMMEAMGYSRNRKPFLDLAHRLPWSVVRSLARAYQGAPRTRVIHGVLLKVAGFAERQAEGTRVPGHVVPVDRNTWCMAGIRPSNQPHRRLAGVAVLLDRFVDSGLIAGLVPMTELRRTGPLTDALTVVEGGVALIGRSRALDITVNVALPLLHAWAVRRDDQALVNTTLRLYQDAPSLAENEITREMATLLGISGTPMSHGGLRQQGLIHLYNQMLREGGTTPPSR